MSFLELNNVSVGFGPVSNRYEVLQDVNLSIKENEFVAVIGFSGSGKSTLMNLLSGLEKPDKGEVLLRGKPITGPSPELGMMFQNYSLLPWMSVYENIDMAVRSARPEVSRSKRKDYIMRYIEMVKLDHAPDKKPHELSGGMRQRASLARTLSIQPEVLLLDEPLSALDALTRADLQDEILKIWGEDKKTVVMITNDVDEAVLMTDRIVPLTIGPKATLDKPFDVMMERPRDRYTLNNNKEFIRLKTDITSYMMGLSKEEKKHTEAKIEMPQIAPKDFSLPSKRLSFKHLQTPSAPDPKA